MSEALRSTAAHSTISIDDINSSDIFFEKNSTTRIANVWSEKFVDKHNFWINSAHSGYKDLFGLVHNRKIHVDSKISLLEDRIIFQNQQKTQSNSKKDFFALSYPPRRKIKCQQVKKKLF